ncbi:OTU family ubiquitin thioesterase [Wolbachia endosymbiont (group B) of Ischnura elegans]|uniref:OTU family ubiquitin thioesterase n=1 Tax=Wolbachia endosymbiont (group B) of Ischnura elegans TaxID=2954021 RepID=UPI00223215A9|nr:OTU family ubiquitin thioesterase [Wolbachia endosymbiont (group B) of Ischnura elegans]
MKNFNRKPIALFRQIKGKKKSNKLLHNLKSTYPRELKIGAAIKTGDCFFDSVAQGLNELNIKPDHYFTAKSLRKDCADYVEQHGKQDSWAYKAVIKDAAIGGYFVALEGPYGPIQDPKTKINMIDEKKTFHEYLKNIKNMATGAGSAPIWGRPNIEGRMICDKYKVELYIYSIEEGSQKVTVTKITAHDDDPAVFIQDIDLNQLEIDSSKKTVGVVNYMRHFVPLLSKIPSDITENQSVSNEEIFGEVTEASASEQPVRQKSSTSEPIFSNKSTPISNQSEQKPLKERAADRSIDERNSQNHEAMLEKTHNKTCENTAKILSETSKDMKKNSSEEILEIGKRVPSSNQSEQEEQYNIRTSKAAIAQDHKEQKTQKERINTSASEPIHTDTVITISHPHEQKTQQEEIQKKLINSYRGEAIYSITTVITAIAFTASAIAAVFTQPIPLACLAGVALAIACVCVYQLTQSHQDINELKGKVGENNTFTFLEETGFKIYSLIDKAASKI